MVLFVALVGYAARAGHMNDSLLKVNSCHSYIECTQKRHHFLFSGSSKD